MDVQSARTVAFEVGLQNGGMASGLAAAMGKLATVGLASAVMTPLGNVSGSLLKRTTSAKGRPTGAGRREKSRSIRFWNIFQKDNHHDDSHSEAGFTRRSVRA